ncbi:urease accessory protein UreE [Desulfohalobiaceae bacterium Ax17]|uniref:urease accessory protein UreE n=1 Tax=Desulfovulcanus ferrireducens TaxID=2831190 RepID=UPI00207BA523|nr:urease accessory protein UreE [Desulfovulcanus ferrireducens]MBT8764331.1 urease accessory protein UreE [Desulfovulcanus ferrireducens]
MLKITKILQNKDHVQPQAQLTLPFELRQKSRQLARLDSGEEVGLFLPRGTILMDGDLLQTDNGVVIIVKAAPEKISIATTQDSLLWARACYHLGNRHVPLQISNLQVAYLHDHVLDEMVKGLGLEVSTTIAPFEPETGAYHSHGHHHH